MARKNLTAVVETPVEEENMTEPDINELDLLEGAEELDLDALLNEPVSVASGFDPVPDGDYHATLERVSVRLGPKGPSVSGMFGVDHPDVGGRTVFGNWSLSPKAMFRLVPLFRAMGFAGLTQDQKLVLFGELAASIGMNPVDLPGLNLFAAKITVPETDKRPSFATLPPKSEDHARTKQGYIYARILAAAMEQAIGTKVFIEVQTKDDRQSVNDIASLGEITDAF